MFKIMNILHNNASKGNTVEFNSTIIGEVIEEPCTISRKAFKNLFKDDYEKAVKLRHNYRLYGCIR